MIETTSSIQHEQYFDHVYNQLILSLELYYTPYRRRDYSIDEAKIIIEYTFCNVKQYCSNLLFLNRIGYYEWHFKSEFGHLWEPAIRFNLENKRFLLCTRDHFWDSEYEEVELIKNKLVERFLILNQLVPLDDNDYE